MARLSREEGAAISIAQLHAYLPHLPVSWTRPEGRTRYVPAHVKNWKWLVGDACKQEIIESGLELSFPHEGPCCVDIIIYHEDEESITKNKQDPDRIMNGILDGMSKIVFPDDQTRYVRSVSLKVLPAPSTEMVGTHIFVRAAAPRV